MKTLADVKRKMTLGSKWRCVRLFEGGKDLGVREVVQVEENAFTVLQNGVPKLKYIYAG